MFLVLPEHRKGSVRYFVSPSTAGLKSEVPHTVRFEIMCPLSPLPPPPSPPDTSQYNHRCVRQDNLGKARVLLSKEKLEH